MKKHLKRVSMITIITFVMQIFAMIPFSPTTEVLATTQQTLIPVKILEVEPGLAFDFTSSSFTSGMFANRPVQLRQMSMPEFISNIDAINGSYDIVYIGNNTSGGATYSANGSGTAIVLPIAGMNTSLTDTSTEHYVENDITSKRAGNLIDYINSKQCIVFANSIFNSSTSTTNLYTMFNGYKGSPGVVLEPSVSTSNLSTVVNDIVNAYSTNSVKRPQVNLSASPIQYTGPTTISTSRLLNYTFDVNSVSNPIDVQLYLDLNGDGLYSDSTEMVKSTTYTGSGSGYNISYYVPNYLTGIIPWNLVITDHVTRAKSITTGSVAFITSDANTPIIRVLQIIPNSGNNYDLASALHNQGLALRVSGQYDIRVTQMKISEFNSNVAAGGSVNDATYGYDDASGKLQALTNQTATTVLNENYDMVMMGFEDSYGSCDLTTASANALKAFVKTKQSLMLTHDLLSYHTGAPNGGNDYITTQQFRDIIGQSRYVDKNNTSQLGSDGVTAIPHIAKPTTNYVYGYTEGALAHMKDGLHTTTQTHKINGGTITDYPFELSSLPSSTLALNTNTNDQINTLRQNDGIPVATTHYQWFQLNLEDPNVIPWYTLDYTNPSPAISTTNAVGSIPSDSILLGNGNSGSTKYDGRNFYYTYSDGTVTYSGTGHSSPNVSGNVLENKLFVNTIIKAARSSNHAPKITCDLVNPQNLARTADPFTFHFTPTDADNDIMTGEVDLTCGTQTKTYSFSNLASALTVPVTIPSTDLSTFVGSNSSFEISVCATDTSGAKATTPVYNINYVSIPTLTLNNSLDAANKISEGNYGYLLGDTITDTVSANISNLSAGNTITNVQYSVAGNDNLTISQGGTWSSLTSAAINGNNAAPTIAANVIKEQATIADTYYIQNNLSYNSNVTGATSQSVNQPFSSSTINVAAGSMNFKFVDDSAQAISVPITATLHVTDSNGIVKDVNINSGNGTLTSFVNATGATTNLATGGYTISLGSLSGYSLVGETIANGNAAATTFDITQPVNLSYSNSNPLITLKLHPYQTPVVKISENPTTQTPKPVKITIDYGVVPVIKECYTIDNGSEQTYVDGGFPITKNNTVIHAYAYSIANPELMGEDTLTVINIDETPATGPVTYYTIDDAGNYTVDASGNKVVYDTSVPTKLNVVASISTSTLSKIGATIVDPQDGNTVVNALGATHTFTHNDTNFAFTLTDALGIPGNIPTSVTKIDKTKPTCTFLPAVNGRNTSNGDLTLALTAVCDPAVSGFYNSTAANLFMSDSLGNPLLLNGSKIPAVGYTFTVIHNSNEKGYIPTIVYVVDEAGNIGTFEYDTESTLLER